MIEKTILNIGFDDTDSPRGMCTTFLAYKIVDLLQKEGELFIDQISAEMGLATSRVSTMLLNLEFKNVLAVLPGQVYKLR